MTTTTTLTIVPLEGEAMPSAKKITKLLAKHGLDDLFETTGEDYSDEKWLLQWNDKWETDGSLAFTEEASQKWPVRAGCDVEWNTQDADEPGRERLFYERGKVAERWEMRLVPVDRHGKVMPAASKTPGVFTYTVTVGTDTQEHADMVMTERLSYDEKLTDPAGVEFDYTISSS